MEQPNIGIGPNTTLTIVRNPIIKQGFAKRSSSVGGPVRFPTPMFLSSSPGGVGGGRIGPPTVIRVATMNANTIPDLASIYLVTISKPENMLRVTLTPGKENEHTPAATKAIMSILEQRGLYVPKMKACIIKTGSKEAYDRLVIGGSPFSWIHPTSKKRTTFLVKYVEGIPKVQVAKNLEQNRQPISSTPSSTSSPKMVAVPTNNSALVPPPRTPTPQFTTKHIPSTQGQQQPRPRGRPPTKKQQIVTAGNAEVSSKTVVAPPRGGRGQTKSKQVEVIQLTSDEDDDDDFEDDYDDDDDDDDSDEDYRESLFIPKSTGNKSPPTTAQAKLADVSGPSNSMALIAEGHVRSNNNISISKSANARRKSVSQVLSATTAAAAAVNSTKVVENTFTTVVRGKVCSLPTKSIVPAGKSLSCHYKIQDLKTFKKTYSKAGLTYQVHPFLGDKFLIVSCQKTIPKNIPSQNKMKTKQPEIPVQRNKRKLSQESMIREPLKKLRSDVRKSSTPEVKSASNRRTSSTPAAVTKTTTTTKSTARPITREISISSSDSSNSSSSGSSSSSSSDSEFAISEDDEKNKVAQDTGRRSTRRAAAISINKNQKPTSSKDKEKDKHVVFKPPPRCFIEAKPCRPLRKSSEGRIYFSLKAKVGPSEHYKNEDLFVNWEKFVRTESCLGTYYKTRLMKKVYTTLVIYHLESEHDKLQVDRSVELASDGTIKVTLMSEDVTSEFMKYVNIDTNTHLSSLLTNLINSNLCPGCPNYSLITVYPEAISRDNIWYSKKCSRVVFHEVEKFTTQPSANHNYFTSDLRCAACKELRNRLDVEKTEIFNLNNKFKKMDAMKLGSKRSRAKQQIVYGKYKPPSVEKIQVRKALSDLFLDFWKDLGFKEEAFPNQTSNLNVDVVTEKDFPEIKEIEEPVPGLPPALPESIPILENIDFDENGQTMLTFSEIPLNPYETGIQNVHFMNSSMTLPQISTDMLDSIMNTSDPDVLVQTLVDIQTPGQTFSGGSQQSSDSQGNNNSTISTTNKSSINYQHNSNPLTDSSIPSHQFPWSSTNLNQGPQSVTHDHALNYQNSQLQFPYDGQQEHHHHDSHLLEDMQIPDFHADTSYSATGMEPHNMINFDDPNLDFNLNDGVESSLMFPTFSLTEL